MNKQNLQQQLLEQLEGLLNEAELAATNARLAAVDEQSKAETQYDTLAIESAYLAEGQSRRIDELNEAVSLVANMPLYPCDTVKLGALFSIEFEDTNEEQFLLAPAGAGQQLIYGSELVKVITPNAPLARSCLNKLIDDEIMITISNNERHGSIITIE